MQRNQGQNRITVQSPREGVQGVTTGKHTGFSRACGDLVESSVSGASGTAPDCSALKSERVGGDGVETAGMDIFPKMFGQEWSERWW